MGQWLVNQRDNQFGVSGLDELRQLATDSKLWPGDMIQPDGASDWIYAVEIPELKDVLPKQDDDDDFEFRKRGIPRWLIGGVFAIISVCGFSLMGYFYTQLPAGPSSLLGEGGTFAYTEMLATSASPLRETPAPNGKPVVTLQKDQTLDLLAKRDRYYKARTKGGEEGWISIDEVVAMYEYAGADVREKYDPLYNPDQYVLLQNASWLMIEAEGNDVTQFSFMLNNDSQFIMTDLVLEAIIKDSKGTVVGTKEFKIEGVLEPKSTSFVGTLNPDEKDVKAANRAGEEPPMPKLMTETTFEEVVKENEELYLRWVASVNVQLEEDFTGAEVRIVELRAVPPETDEK
jgi:hypothetical protein